MNDFMEKYLGEVDRRLRRLPVAERVDIVNELKSEIAELSAAGLSGEEIEDAPSGSTLISCAFFV